jgi:hypothetical protein
MAVLKQVKDIEYYPQVLYTTKTKKGFIIIMDYLGINLLEVFFEDSK